MLHQDLLSYYQRELTHLRRLAKQFAEANPKIASRLMLQDDTCEDPHVERLLEGVAFLAARVQHKIDDEFPEITDALLNILYPHYQRPVPSMTILQFAVDSEQTELTSRYDLARGTRVLSKPVRTLRCEFRTCYPVDLWPIRVSDASVDLIERSPYAGDRADADAVLRLRLRCIGDTTFGKLGVDRLRFFLDAEPAVAHSLYELLLNDACGVTVTDGVGKDSRRAILPADSLVPVGFGADDGMVEYDPRSFRGFRLLYEYFVFPEKFLFVDVCNLDKLRNAGREIEVAVFFEQLEPEGRLARLAEAVGKDTFRLGCTPAVNLFPQSADAIKIDHTKSEYPVTPDARRRWGYEVYSIKSVVKLVRTRPDSPESVVGYEPIYALRHATGGATQSTFWHARRKESESADDVGSEVFLSLVDLKFDASLPDAETLSVSTLCTNRDIPQQLPFGGTNGDFELEGQSVVSAIRCLRRPSPTRRPPIGRKAQWRLISHLALNHLSLVEGGREALWEILSLYNFDNGSATRKQITGIVGIRSRRCSAGMGPPQRRAFVRGTEIELEFDERQYSGSSVFLMSSVLERFFGMYCSVNSFVRLVVRSQQREGVLKQWPPRAGDAVLT